MSTTTPAAAPQPTQDPSKCATHGLVKAPDGKCALCRRAEYAAADAQPSGSNKFLLLGMVAAALVAFYFMASQPASRPESSGPSIEEELGVVNTQIDDLEHEKKTGNLSAQGHMKLDILKQRRNVLEMQKERRDQSAE